MNTKKLQDIKIIKNKLNNAMVLIEEINNLMEEFPQVDTSHLLDALDDLENQYWEIEELQD